MYISTKSSQMRPGCSLNKVKPHGRVRLHVGNEAKRRPQLDARDLPETGSSSYTRPWFEDLETLIDQ